MRILDSPDSLESELLGQGAWVPVGQCFGFDDKVHLLPSLRKGYRSSKRFKITTVLVSRNLIDIWYLDSTGAEQLMSFRYEFNPRGLIYSRPEML